MAEMIGIFRIFSRGFILAALFFGIPAGGVSFAAGIERLSLGHTLLSSTESEMSSSAIGALTAQYGFLDKEPFKPYIGAGLAYSVDKELKGSNPATRIKAGMSYQIGFMYTLSEKSSLNLKYDLYNFLPESPHRGNDAMPGQVGWGLKIAF